MRNIARSLALILIAIIASVGFLAPTPAAAKSVTWKNYDVTLTLNGDGTFHVVERQVVDFEGGPFSNAFAEIPLARVDDITDVRVSEDRDGDLVRYDQSRSNDSETFEVDQNSSSLSVKWYMPKTTDDVRTFVLEYDVLGGLRVYESPSGQRQQIWWTAISDEVTEVASIESATFSIELPQAVDLANVVIDGPGSNDPAEHTTDNRVFTWSRDNMDSGDALEARLVAGQHG
jgi:hypothetical protein